MIGRHLREIQDRIAKACDQIDRDPQSVTLVAVSKTFTANHVRAAYDAGQRHFGESKLQEAIPKVEALPSDIVWHFIGKLQSNKAKKAAGYFQVIHTIESESQLREFEKADRPVEGLIEVNIAEEEQKSGIFPGNIDSFHHKVLQYKNVQFRGLMTIGPANRNAEDSRPFFRNMRSLSERFGGGWLSMGMSNDFDVAIQEGATHVRIGTAIFGER